MLKKEKGLSKKLSNVFRMYGDNLKLEVTEKGFTLWFIKGIKKKLLIDASLIRDKNHFHLSSCYNPINIDKNGDFKIKNGD